MRERQEARERRYIAHQTAWCRETEARHAKADALEKQGKPLIVCK